MDSPPECKMLKIRPCTKLQKEKLCTVYTRDSKKKCRKYRNARKITEEDVLRARPLKRVEKIAAKSSPKQLNSVVNIAPSSVINIAPRSAPRSAPKYIPKTPEYPVPNFPEEKKDEEQGPLIEHDKPKRKLVRVKKLPTTLEKVQAIWGGVEGQQIAEDIDDLERDPSNALRNLIKSTGFRNSLEQELATIIDMADKTEHIERYVRLRSKAVSNVIPTLIINGVELKKNLLKNIDKGASVIFENLEESIVNALEDKKTNSSVVYQTAQNVKSSEIIDYTMVQDANLTSFQSILNNFTDFEAFDKDSSSDSIIMTAKFRPDVRINSIRESFIPDTKFYFKMYPLRVTDGGARTEDIDNEGLQTELFCYNQLFMLSEHNITPNILCKVATSVLPDFNTGGNDFISTNKMNMAQKGKLNIQISDINDNELGIKDLQWLQTGVIMTQPGGGSFFDRFRSLNVEDRRKILFQLFYTLYVFEQIEFSHGDLHTGNIFIVDVPETELCYIVNGVQYRFKTEYLLKIYDFDHSMIAKNTSLRVNTTEHFNIARRLNQRRTIANRLNTRYAEPNIFNKNLDILIFTNSLAYTFPKLFDHFKISTTNNEINDFFRDCFPGFDSANPISQEIIQLTYLRLLADNVNREEANRIFDIRINRAEDLGRYELGIGVFTSTWIDYFKKIKDNFSRIVKNITGSVRNNHMWIPDTIVIPKREMLANRYFDSLRSVDPIDIRRLPVYTIDNRIM